MAKKEEAVQAVEEKEKNTNVEELKKEIETLRNDLLKLTKAFEKVGEEKIKQAVGDVKDRITEKIPKEQLERLESVKAQGEEAIEAIKKQQKEHPLGTLLVAVGLGFLLGRIMGGNH